METDDEDIQKCDKSHHDGRKKRINQIEIKIKKNQQEAEQSKNEDDKIGKRQSQSSYQSTFSYICDRIWSLIQSAFKKGMLW